MDSLSDSDIELFESLDERWASYEANVQARFTRRPGVCLVTLGAGALNAVTGVVDAKLDQVPMVILIGQRASHTPPDDVHQLINLHKIYKEFTKNVYTITEDDLNPKRIRAIVSKAFRTAVTPPMGPCAIIIPENFPLQDLGVVETAPIIETKPYARRKAQDWGRKVKKIVRMIKESEFPIFIFGSGGARVDKQATAGAANSLMVSHSLPATSTYMGKGIIPFGSLLCLSPINNTDDLAAKFISELCDLVITVGYFGGECDPVVWNRYGNKTIIHINYTHVATRRTAYTPKVKVLANISKTLQAINKGLGTYRTKPYAREAVAQVRQLHNAIIQRARKDTRMHENSAGMLSMNPIGVIARIRESLARDVITVCDVGEHKMLIGTYFSVFLPRTHVNFNGLSGMGGSVPGGIATKLAFPKKRVMVFCGDGGFL